MTLCQGPRSYFESCGADKWLKVVDSKNTFFSVTLYNFQKSGRAIALQVIGGLSVWGGMVGRFLVVFVWETYPFCLEKLKQNNKKVKKK